MTVKGTLSVLVAALTLIIIGGGLYYYWTYVMPGSVPPVVEALPVAVPDPTVAAGPVTSVSATSVSITKQDGATATFAITSATAIVGTAEGRPGDPVPASSMRVGARVLITPSAQDAGVAQTIVLLGSN